MGTMLAAFVTALHACECPTIVKIQVLQSLSILVQNVRQDTSMIYLLSGGLLNTFFDEPPKLDDEEMLAYFVSLLKGLALRLTPDNAQLCLVDVQPSASERPWDLLC